MGSSCFHLLEKKFKTWRTGTSQEEVGQTADGVKWDSLTYLFTSINTGTKRNYKQIICKWVNKVYEHIYTINIQYIKKWYTYVEKWDTHGEKWDVMSQFSPYIIMLLCIVPVLPMPTRFITHSLTQ